MENLTVTLRQHHESGCVGAKRISDFIYEGAWRFTGSAPHACLKQVFPVPNRVLWIAIFLLLQLG